MSEIILKDGTSIYTDELFIDGDLRMVVATEGNKQTLIPIENIQKVITYKIDEETSH